MRKYLYALFVPLFLIAASLTNTAKASHVAGGDISYISLGNDSFVVIANFFRDCSGISAPTSVTMNFSSTCGNSFTQVLTLQNPGGTEVSQLCPSQLTNSECSGGTLPGMQQYIYMDTVVISPPCDTWTLYYRISARNPSVNVPGSTGLYFHVEATLNSQTDPTNSSPVFTAQPIPYVCAGQNIDYSYGVTEPDGDSLYFFISSGYSNTGVPLPYSAPYTTTAPIVGITIDPQTGQLNFTAPTTNGSYVVVVCVEEYDPSTGDLVGSTCRDIQFIVQACSNDQPSLVAGGYQNFSGGGTLLDSNSIEVCVGNTISFDIEFDDPDTLDTVSLSSNIASVLPGAIVTYVPGNPASMSVTWTAVQVPGNFLIFNVAAQDDACPVAGIASQNFDITVIPATYAGEDQTICLGSQSAQIHAIGGDTFTWSVISGDPISPSNFSCNPCANPVASPSVTTTYQVTSNLSGGCDYIDTITIYVAPDFNLTSTPDTLICSIADIPLFANPDQPYSYTWQWTPSSSLTNDTIQNPVANPDENTQYVVTVTSALGCTKMDTVNVSLSPPFPPNITMGPVDINDTVICFGDSVELYTNLGDLIPASCGLANSQCIGVTETATIGTGTATNTGTSYPAPYGNWYWGAKHQMLFTAAELNAQGITGGQISSLAFDVATVGSTQNFQNFEIKMGCTSLNSLTSWQSGLYTVLPGYTHTVTAGWNLHQFATPYEWDGVSNIIVEVCFNNSSYLSNGNSQTRYTPTTFNSVLYYRSDISTVCSSPGSPTSSLNRPNVQFNYCTGADPAAFTYAWSPTNGGGDIDTTVFPINVGYNTYTVYVADTFGGCIDTISTDIRVVTEFNAGFEFDDPLCLNGGTDTAEVIIAGGTFSGTGIIDPALGIFDPAVAGVGTHPITYTITGNCANDSTIGVEVIPLPDATITSPDEFCVVGGPYQLTAATAGGIWSGPGITDPVQGIYDNSSLGLGTFNIVYTLTQPCFNSDTIQIKNILPYVPEIIPISGTICANDTADTLSFIVNTGNNYGNGPYQVEWSGPGISDSLNGVFNASLVGAGTYTITITVSEPNGTCSGTDTYDVTVLPLPDATFSSEVYCDNIDANKYVVAATPGIGTWSVNPISPTTGSFNPNSFTPSQVGAGTWELTYELTGSNGCFNSFMDTFRIAETPESPILEDLSFCAGDELILSVIANNTDSVIWYDAASTIRPTDSVGVGVPFDYGYAEDPAIAGQVTLWVTESNYGCESDPVRWDLPVRPSPDADFTMAYVDTNGVYNSNVSTGYVVVGYAPMGVEFSVVDPQTNEGYIWDFAANCNSGTAANSGCPCPPTIGFETLQDGSFDPETIYPVQAYTYGCSDQYLVYLIVENEYGCRDTASTYVDVVGTTIIPNIFTPNGDGRNDYFQVVKTGLVDYKLTIYNRWGREVYTQNYSCSGGEEGCGWDGKINGSEAADGVYFWVLEGKTLSGDGITEKGNVTLLRGN